EALPGGRDRSGVSRAYDGIELADVDPELEGVRRDDAQDLTLPEAPLDVAPLLWQVAAPVGDDARRIDAASLIGATRLRGHRVAKVTEHHLDGVARLPEDQRGHARRDEIRRQHHGLLHVAR